MLETAVINEINAILSGKEVDPEKILKLVKTKLKNEKAFDAARRVLEMAGQHPEPRRNADLALKIAQQQSLCTYKDQNLSVHKRFDQAVAILKDAHDKRGDTLEKTINQETLGLMGAIYKYRWEVSGQKHYLERALNYYLRGYKEGVDEKDYGYTAINAAFVLDLLASMESVGVKPDDPVYTSIERRQTEAAAIRQEIIHRFDPPETDDSSKTPDDLPTDTWWFLVTIGEAYFGLAAYEAAEAWYQKAINLPDVPDWEKESTTRQLATLARTRLGDRVWDTDFRNSREGRVLAVLVGEHAMRGMLMGKIGLALSGGGFRASFFHIGVLARLAELDMLRHVDVISCVSGGSIIGAHYYLELRKELREHPDTKMDREDYIKLVQQVAEKFLEGVQKNIRTQVMSEFKNNLKMIYKPNYSRTIRTGELYEKDIFSLVEDGEGNRPRLMTDLLIQPRCEGKSFSPKLHNWRRNAKVPMLILNATTLNTGHNWQFTASWMGEPPANIEADIDTNYRLRRMYYSEAPDAHKTLRLGHAVAASSCVPGLFEPLSLADLYQQTDSTGQKTEPITVKLVDGGVHDNQGVASLLEQECSVMLISDACGQMDTDKEPSKNTLGVLFRSNSVMMARIREAEYRELDARKQAAFLKGMMFLHLKKGLDTEQVDWLNIRKSSEALNKAVGSDPVTSYGIKKEIQKSLSNIRTDLDSFSEAEAYALMYSGYRMTEKEFPSVIKGFPATPHENPDWPFLVVSDAMGTSKGHDAEHQELKRLLDVGSKRMFKIWWLIAPLKVIGLIAVLAIAVAFFWACFKWASVSLLSLGMLGSMVATLAATAFIKKRIVKVVRFRDTILEICVGIGMSFAGSFIAKIHLRYFDKTFKEYGKIRALQKRARS